MVQIERLWDELRAAGFAVEVGVHRVLPADSSRWRNATWHARPNEVVRLDWPAPPTAPQEAAAAAVVLAHAGDRTIEEKMDQLGLPVRTLAATMKAVQLIHQAMPANIRPALPAWVTRTYQEAMAKIQELETQVVEV